MEKIKSFDYRCQKVLPLVYDDSLSYYEVLCKLVSHINKIGDIVNTLNTLQNIDLSKIYFIGEIEDISYFTNTTKCGLLVVNNGEINKIPDNTVFEKDLSILFICGTMHGDFTIKGKIISDRKQIFSSSSNVNVSAENNPVGYPEYFGATVNDIAITNEEYITKCYNTFNVTSLSAGDYYINDTIVLDKSHKEMHGVAINQEYGYTDIVGTRIVQLNNNKSGILVGDSTPSGITTVKLHDFSVLNFKPEYANITAGISINGARALYLHDVTVNNFNLGFNFTHVVQSYMWLCRYLTTKPSNDKNYTTGINLNLVKGSVHGISSIVSLFVWDCDVHYNYYNKLNRGVVASGEGGLADFVLDRTNFHGCATGVLVDSNDESVYQQDNWIRSNVIDNCVDGVRINGNVRINIIDNWVSCTKELPDETKHCVYITNVKNEGGVVCTGNNLKLAEANNDANVYGFRLVQSSGLVINDNIVYNFPNPCLASDVTDSKLHFMCNTSKIDINEYAAKFEKCIACDIEVGVCGSKTYQNGVQLRECVYCRVNPNMLRTSKIKAAKVVLGSVPATNNDIYKNLENGNTICGSL